MALDWPLVGDVLAKLALAGVLGGIIGAERELHGRPAGIRTHMLLVVGVTLFCEVSKHFGGNDLGRIAAQVVTGVGFLGAGTIMKLGAEVKGLTTAASLWAASAIGMAVSVGGSFFVVAPTATVLALVILTIVDSVERRLIPTAHPKRLLVRLRDREALWQVVDAIRQTNNSVLAFEGSEAQPDVVCLTVARLAPETLEALSHRPDVESASWDL